MFFLLSKIIGWMIHPLAMVLLGLTLALVVLRRGYARAAKRLIAACLVLVLAGGLLPLGSAIILPLEERFARPLLPQDAQIDGILVLGGAETANITHARSTPTMNDAGERMSETMSLARRFPKARVVFSGGSGELIRPTGSNAAAAEMFFVEQGLDKRRLVLEEKSRNTQENAAFTKALIMPKPGERWLLVTSAFHMPRSMGCFRKAGWEMLPWPVDYRTAGAGDLLYPVGDPTMGFRRLDLAWKEWIGLVAYRMTGRTDALFPAPRP
jgi:uncharacterized SAM-binding protein YcdF (DUF218 family)